MPMPPVLFYSCLLSFHFGSAFARRWPRILGEMHFQTLFFLYLAFLEIIWFKDKCDWSRNSFSLNQIKHFHFLPNSISFLPFFQCKKQNSFSFNNYVSGFYFKLLYVFIHTNSIQHIYVYHSYFIGTVA